MSGLVRAERVEPAASEDPRDARVDAGVEVDRERQSAARGVHAVGGHVETTGSREPAYGRRSATRMLADGAASGVMVASAPSVSIAA